MAESKITPKDSWNSRAPLEPRRTLATPSMIVASIDALKRVDGGLVTHV